MKIADFVEQKKYRMPWWESKAYITRTDNVYTLHNDNGESEIIDFKSAHNFKICAQYVEVS